MKTLNGFLESNDVNGGVQNVFKFNNGYGASVVKHNYSYGGDRGLWELAVLLYDGDSSSLTYDTSITDDVLGWLTEEDVKETLVKIEQL